MEADLDRQRRAVAVGLSLFFTLIAAFLLAVIRVTQNAPYVLIVAWVILTVAAIVCGALAVAGYRPRHLRNR